MMVTVVLLCAYIVFALPSFAKRLPIAVRGITGSGGRAPERESFLWTAALLAISAVVFYPLWDSHMLFQKEDGSVWTGGSCWADFPIHMHITQSMLHGRNKAISLAGMHSPIFADRPLTYPYLPDFHAAVMVWFGSTLRQVYFATGFLSFLALVGLVFSLGTRMTSSRVAAVAGVVCLVCLGGVGGVNILLKHGWDFALTKDAIQADVVGDNIADGAVFWFGFLPHVFLPQRGATFAYPAVAAAALVLWQAIRPSRSAAALGMPLPERRFLLIVCAALSALLPLVQAHSFAGLAVFVAVVFILDAHSWAGNTATVFKAWLPAGVVAGVLFIPQWLVFGRMVDGKGHFLELLPVFSGHGSSAPDALKAVLGQNNLLLDFVWCWTRAMGPFLPAFLVAMTVHGVVVAMGASEAVTAVISPGSAPTPYRNALDSASRHASDHTFPLDPHDGVLRHAAEAGIGAFGSSAVAGVGPSRLAASKKDDDATMPPPASAAVSRADAEVSGPRGGWKTVPAEDGDMDPDVPFGFFARHPLPRCYGVPPGFENLLSTTADEIAPPMDGPGTDDVAEARRRAFAAEVDPVGAAAARVVDIAGAAQPLVSGIDSVTPEHRRLSAFKFAAASFAVFVVGCFVKFQPWDRDNTKIFYIFAIIAAPFVGQVLTWPLTAGLAAITAPTEARIHGADADTDADADAAGITRTDTHTAEAKQSRQFVGRFGGILLLLVGVPVGAALLALGATSGVLSIVREYGMFHELYGPMEVEVGDYIRDNIPAKSVMLTDNTHRAPAGYLAGRPSLAGYDGWLWSHGYDYAERHNDRNFIMQHVNDVEGRDAYDKMRRWGVRYVVSEHKGQPEGAGDNKDMFLDSNTKRIFSSGRYQVFEVLGYDSPPT